MVQVFAFGHSITYGNWDTEGGWVQRLRTFLDEKALEEQDEELVSEVFNMGVPGETSEELLERFDDELERRLWEQVDQLVILQIGANDSLEIVGKGQVQIPEKEFRANLAELIDRAKRYTENVFVISESYTSIDGKIPWAEEHAISDERLEDYVEIQREVCRDREVELIDLRGLRSKEEWLEMLEEGMHPDNQGHELIFEELKKRMEDRNLL